jgi:small ligand-binding sensory domain FIST
LSDTFPAEELLIKVIDDLADFLPYLVLVGVAIPSCHSPSLVSQCCGHEGNGYIVEIL